MFGCCQQAQQEPAPENTEIAPADKSTAVVSAASSAGGGADRSLAEKSLAERSLATTQQSAALTEKEEDPLPVRVRSFHVKIHSAELSRSFAKVGWMDPYAIVVLGDSKEEAGRTQAAAGAHKKPVWEADFELKHDTVPETLTIAVWDKNSFHKDVFCGSTTVPCAQDMGLLERKDFVLTKHDKPTGQVKLTITVELEAELNKTRTAAELPVNATRTAAPLTEGTRSSANLPAGGSRSAMINSDVGRTQSGLGPELDTMAAWSGEPAGAAISFKQGSDWAAQGSRAAGEAAVKEEVGPPTPIEPESATPASPLEPAAAPEGAPAAPMVGKWKCVDTWGLDEFLKAQKRSFFERKMAMNAKWPDWEFKSEGDKLVYLNNTMIGLLTEEIQFGREYENIDGQKNKWTVNATWTTSGAAGGVLTQKRKGAGPLGEVVEERTVDGDKLDFKCTKDGFSWGRSFVRDK